MEFTVATAATGQRVTVCRVDLTKDALQLFLRDDNGKPLKSLEGVSHFVETKGHKLVFAMNAGMYEADLSPVGLFIANRRQIAPLNLRNAFGNFYLKPNGVFLISDLRAHIIESSEYPAFEGLATLATQSGPLLVNHGNIHPAFKPNSASRLYRNGVGISSAGIALFAITEAPMNLYEFAVFFRDVLHCPDALFFDGTVSSLYAPELKRNDKHIDLGPMIGVTE